VIPDYQDFKNYTQSICYSAAKVKPVPSMSYSSAKKTQSHYIDDPYFNFNNQFGRTESKNYLNNNNYNMTNMITGYSVMDNYDMDFMNFSTVENNNNFNNSFSQIDGRKSLLEIIQNKDNEIKALNHNIEKTIHHCENIIKETEENYLSLKVKVY